MNIIKNVKVTPNIVTLASVLVLYKERSAKSTDITMSLLLSIIQRHLLTQQSKLFFYTRKGQPLSASLLESGVVRNAAMQQSQGTKKQSSYLLKSLTHTQYTTVYTCRAVLMYFPSCLQYPNWVSTTSEIRLRALAGRSDGTLA